MAMTPSAAASSRLWLVRHASRWLPEHLLRRLGRAADAQATRAAAERLATALPPGASSFIPRYKDVAAGARITSAQTRFDLHPDARLREMDFGRWEG